MTDQIYEQISAFLDDELSAEQSAFLVRRLESDAGARKQFVRYAAIGSAVRGELVDPSSAILRQRIQASLSGASPDWRPAGRSQRRASRLKRAVAGFALAATVAGIALVGLRNINQAATDDQNVAAANFSVSNERPEPESYVVPPAVTEARIISPPIRLTNYLVQHGSYASMLTRTSVQANVVSIREPEVPADETESDGDSK